MSLEEVFYQGIEEYIHKYFEINPLAATYLGIHKYDHLLPKGGWEGFREEEKFIKEFKEWYEGFKKNDLSGLSFNARIDVELVERSIKLWEFQMYEWRLWAKYPSAPSTISSSIFILFGRDFAPFPIRLKSIVGRLERAPEYLRRSMEVLIEPVKKYIDIGIEISRQLTPSIEFLIHLSQSITGENEDIERMWRIHDILRDEVEEYINWLEDIKRDASDEYRIGPELFEKLLKIRGLGISSDEILELGIRYLKHFKEEARKLSKEIVGVEDVEKAREIVESDYPRDFNEIIKLYEESIERARAFIIEKRIAPVPEGENIKVLETPPFMAPVIPFAAYIGPAPYEDRKEGIYLVTRPSKESDFKRHNIYSISNTTVHEAYPGHHLQMVWATIYKNLPRLISIDTAFVEGWAHYCEDLMKEYGYDDTSKHRFVQVLDSIWRAVRVVVDVRLSRREMTFEEAVEMLVRETGMDRAAAEAEVKRYILSPGYQLSYLLGRHLFSKMRREVKEVLGDEFDDYKFHKIILESSGLPFNILKKLVLHEFQRL